MGYLPVLSGYCSGLFFFVCLTVCLNLIAIRFSSMKDSVSVTSASSVSKSDNSSPVRWISPFCLLLSGSLCMAPMFQVSSSSWVKASMMEIDVCVARGLFKMVASM